MFHVKFNLLFVSHLIFISRYLFYLPACLSVSDDRISSPPSTSPRGFSSSSNICILLFLYRRKGDNTFVCTMLLLKMLFKTFSAPIPRFFLVVVFHNCFLSSRYKSLFLHRFRKLWHLIDIIFFPSWCN